jgi:mitogen-activated protein kinase kinase kinase
MISLEASTLLDPGSPHGSTPTSPSFTVSPAARQPQMRSTRPDTPVQNVTLDNPSNVPFIEYLRQWNDQLVARWLADSKCAHHAQTFANHDIRGDILLDLDQQTLREMGIASVGDRIKILNGVKSLRSRCSKAHSKTNGHSPDSQRLPVKLHDSVGDAVSSMPPRNTLKRLESGRPPPLHLTSSASRDLPQLIRAENGRTVRPLPHPHGHTHTHSGSSVKDINGNTRGLPPLPPPPKAQPPAPPSQPRIQAASAGAGAGSRSNLLPPQHHSGRRTPTPIDPPPPFTKDPLPPAPAAPGTPSSTGTPWTGEYGLPRGPSPGNLGGGRTPTTAMSARSTSPLPPPRSRTMALPSSAAHNRSGSAANPSHHPYAAPSSVQAALQPPPNPVVNALSPIAESFMSQHSGGNSTPSPPTAGPSSGASQGYTVGRGPFRPTTPSARAPMSAEDIRRKCVKFILADDGHSRVVNVEDIPRGAEVLEHVLRKFGKFGGIGFPSMDPDDLDSTDPDEGLVVDGWGVFLDDGLADSPGEFQSHPIEYTCAHVLAGKNLSESELLFICHAEPDNPAREHGLTLRRIGKPKRSKVLERYFGEPPPRPSSPNIIADSMANPDARTVKQMNRASSISILSGLGVPDPERALAPPPDVASKPASPTPSFRSKTQSKLRNFLGQRPPSELITTHLQEYFPFTEKKVLERTQRQSMMLRAGHSSTRPDSRRFSRQSWNQPLESRFSASTGGGSPSRRKSSISPPLPPVPLLQDSLSIRSGRSIRSTKSILSNQSIRSTDHDRDELPPRMSVETEDGQSIDLAGDTAAESSPHLLPPVQFPSESLSESLSDVSRALGRTSSNASMSRRVSYLAELRSKRDRSDTASMLTVDEITQEVESRRASLVAEGKDPEAEDAEDEDGGNTTAVDAEEEEEEEGEDTAINEEDEAGEEEEHKAVTSNGGMSDRSHLRTLLNFL